ncbi:hypothetical protein GCM10009756_18400 [Pseudokineococcus marinus]
MKRGSAPALTTRGAWATWGLLLLVLSGLLAMHGLSATHGLSAAAAPSSGASSSLAAPRAAHSPAEHPAGQPAQGHPPFAARADDAAAAAADRRPGLSDPSLPGALTEVPGAHVVPVDPTSAQVLSAEEDHGGDHLMAVGCLLALVGAGVGLGALAAARLLRTPWSTAAARWLAQSHTLPGGTGARGVPWRRPRISLCVVRV